MVSQIKDPYTRDRTALQLNEYAKEQKFPSFMKMLKSYQQSIAAARSSMVYTDNITEFDGQPLELNAGDWEADDTGIFLRGKPEDVACVHPIMPVERLVNVDTGVEKLRIAFRKGGHWRNVIVDKKTLAVKNSITALADCGVAVTSENAGMLVRFLHDMENLNYELIPETRSVSRLGWISDTEFSPYCDELTFDGNDNFKMSFASVTKHGTFKKWLDACKDIRKGSITSRVILASSFASALVRPLGALPFFVHLWGGTEVGKTVGLFMAASVWGKPDLGHYTHTFNSTTVGKEMLASFYNSMPLILDELQVVRSRANLDEDIYKLAEGVGRTRSNKSLGINRSSTWSNCILTSGETPLASTNAGGGAVNRIIEIECQDKLFEDARAVADVVRKNYGHAGRVFIESLLADEDPELAQKLYRGYYDKLSKHDATEKQAMAAAIILTGDALATAFVFKDSKNLTTAEISIFLQSKAAVSANVRGYEYLRDWVLANAGKFDKDTLSERFGEIDMVTDTAYINRAIFNRAVSEEGYSPAALLSYLKRENLIDTRGDGRGFTMTKRIGGLVGEYVALHLRRNFEDLPDDEPVPFP